MSGKPTRGEEQKAKSKGDRLAPCWLAQQEEISFDPAFPLRELGPVKRAKETTIA